MILIFGGTTEGRKAVAVCEEAGKPFYYSTKSDSQIVETVNGIHVTGGMDEAQMRSFCREKKIRLLVDAAHPFAEALHRNVAAVAKRSGISVIRYERDYPERDKELLWFGSYGEAINYLEDHHIDNLLALTGVNTLPKLKRYWQNHRCWFRILDREESRSVVEQEGFPFDRTVYYDQGEDDVSLFKRLKPQAILIKESGASGGFNEKTAAAAQLNIRVLAIRRPVLSPSFISVYGPNGLRKKIESLYPVFFELKTGYTTGTCAAAATKAALTALLTGEEQSSADIALPDGEVVRLPVFSTVFEGQRVRCSVLKDAGDDPDVTNGQEIASTVQLNTLHKDVCFLPGEGVGTVTLPGLGLPVGEPAVNETPRTMIRREVAGVLHRFRDKLSDGAAETGVDVTLSVPGGEEIARKTFNPKLGVVGGISIIGTSGIVKPFSSEAFVASIRREMQVAKALGCRHVVINSGAKSERLIRQRYPELSPQAFVHYGNFIGETVRIASELGFERLTLGIMIGKAVKLAEGFLDTHSKKGVMNKDFLLQLAQEAGCPEETVKAVREITMARQLWEIIPPSERTFFSLVVARCYSVCKPLFANGELEVLLMDEK
ncbi:MAG: cobalt-precorrin-5B (C(1))-methyltransferase CbiD [Culturomica sp.]|jgi:cobalt-precorrin-5B (C1)-methyltransferase|nr:cobalt-precorrin-5B (C(1))-methyltransferase CbiD [Culturomica sp.]